MKRFKAALIGCSRMGAFIDNEGPKERRQGAYSHAAGYEASNHTELVACSDLRTEVLEQTGLRYNIPKQKQYLDYKEMIDREQPEIISIATQPEHRSEIVIYAAEHGAKAIYAEKAMAASMADADAMVEAVEKNNVFFNMGTNRRWDPGYDTMKAVVDSGRIGKLIALVIHSTGHLFNTASHSFDLLQRLNSDCPVSWVQAHLPNGDEVIDGEKLIEDPIGQGILQFENGVTAYALNTGRGMEVEAHGDNGCVMSRNNEKEWLLREPSNADYGEQNVLVDGEFPSFKPDSSTRLLIEDLIHSIESGQAPRGGVRLARANTELIFAFIKSHLQGGTRINLPLRRSRHRLMRKREPRQPKYQR